MPAYLFTLHSYRSWNADHPRGYVRYGQGIRPPSATVAQFYNVRAKQSPVYFDDRKQQVITWIVLDACRRRAWRLHCVAFEPSHVHLLVSWRSNDSWQVVRRKIKNLIGWALSKEFAAEGRKWMVRRGSRKRVRERGHFEYLMTRYLPRHRGFFWKEGDPEPQTPAWADAVACPKPPASAGG
jgi:hypothetical protein